MSRLAQAFARPGQPKLVAFATAGDPDVARSADVLRAMARGGADVLEVGVPFSDPIADGPVIQRAIERALAGGTTMRRALDLVRSVRPDLDVPVVLFTYVNPVLRMGTEEFVSRAADAGVDGVLLLDLPIEESAATRDALARRGIDQIFLVSPTTTPARLREAARLGRGFLYAISRLGVTGARDAVAESAAPLVERVREVTSLPVALGFGISRPEHVREVTRFADAAVVGSALVQVIADATRTGGDVPARVEAFIRWLKGTSGE
ncbi:MAG: tryptophan synthase subunit alpha [Acidobacteria bacterium]|nr:tryptophan synthase subunit alpha [Acidobacteriota bacterium]